MKKGIKIFLIHGKTVDLNFVRIASCHVKSQVISYHINNLDNMSTVICQVANVKMFQGDSQSEEVMPSVSCFPALVNMTCELQNKDRGSLPHDSE